MVVPKRTIEVALESLAMKGDVEEDMFLEMHGNSERFTSHKSNSSNLEQDIKLADEVRKYPCLYDKQNHAYRRNDPNMEPWGLVSNACDWIPNADEACRLFEVLKKRYSKKKMDFRRANFFATSSELVNKTKEELEKYQFMSWMEPHIRHRTVKLVKDTDLYNEEDTLKLKSDFEKAEKVFFIDELSECNKRRISPVSKQFQTQFPISLSKRRRDSGQDALIRNHSMSASANCLRAPFTFPETSIEPVTPRERSVSCLSIYNAERQFIENDSKVNKKMYQKTPVVLDKKINSWRGYYPTYSTVNTGYFATNTSSPYQIPNNLVYQRKLLKNEDEVFSEMVLNEVKKLNGIAKCLAKHEIVNVLFNAQLRQYGKINNPSDNKTAYS